MVSNLIRRINSSVYSAATRKPPGQGATALQLAFTRADVELLIVVACPAALLVHGARADTGVASEDAAAAVGDPNVRDALEEKAAEAVVADAPVSKAGPICPGCLLGASTAQEADWPRLAGARCRSRHPVALVLVLFSRHSDAPAAREGGLLLHDGNRALRRAAQLRRAPILTQVRLLHPIVGPHRVEDLVSK